LFLLFYILVFAEKMGTMKSSILLCGYFRIREWSFNDDCSPFKIRQSNSVKARFTFLRRWNALREPSKGTYGNTFN